MINYREVQGLWTAFSMTWGYQAFVKCSKCGTENHYPNKSCNNLNNPSVTNRTAALKAECPKCKEGIGGIGEIPTDDTQEDCLGLALLDSVKEGWTIIQGVGSRRIYCPSCWLSMGEKE